MEISEIGISECGQKNDRVGSENDGVMVRDIGDVGVRSERLEKKVEIVKVGNIEVEVGIFEVGSEFSEYRSE